MDKTQMQKRLSKQIVIFNGLLILITIVYYFLHGFDAEEFSSLITLLTAISAVYVGTLFQFIGQSIEKPEEKEENQTTTTKIPYANVLKWIVPVHFVLVLLIISALFKTKTKE